MSLLGDCGNDLGRANHRIEELEAQLASRPSTVQLEEEVQFHMMMSERATAALKASRGEVSELRLKYEHLREIVSQALVKGRELCQPSIVVKMPEPGEKVVPPYFVAAPPRANCILNADSPSYPPETDEYRQCGCTSCRSEYERRLHTPAAG